MKTRTVVLTPFSMSGFCLPTYQKAKLETTGHLWWKKKRLTFYHYPNWNPLGEDPVKVTIDVK